MLNKVITLLSLIVLLPLALLLLLALDGASNSAPEIAAEIGMNIRRAVDLAFLCARVALALGGLGGAVFVGRMIWKPIYEHNQQRDGSHRLRTYTVRDAATGEKVKILVAPDLMVSPALAIGNHGVRELGSYDQQIYSAQAAKRALVSEWQARTPGDTAVSSKFGSMYRPPAARPALPARAQLPAPRIIGDEAQQPSQQAQQQPPQQPLQLTDALHASSADEFVLGQSADGALALWRPAEHLSLGVFGVSGTGKTRSVGFETVLLAARHNYHVVVLDPKGGVDFGPFADYVEWQPADAYTFPDQVAALLRVHEARSSIMRARGIGQWRDLGPSAGPEIVVVMEEFGAIRQEISMGKGGSRKLEGVDQAMEMMFRLSRATGFHFVVIDQAPEKLHPVVRGGCKLRAAFQLDVSSASVLKEYEATALPPVGAFLLGRKQYGSWDCSVRLPRLLAQLPPFDHERLLPAPSEHPNGAANGSERPAPVVVDAPNAPNGGERGWANTPAPPPVEPPFDVRSAPKRQVVWWWRDHNPTGSQAEFRTWLADRGVTIARGYISDAFALWAEERAAALPDEEVSLEALRASGVPLAFEGRHGVVGWDEKE